MREKDEMKTITPNRISVIAGVFMVLMVNAGSAWANTPGLPIQGTDVATTWDSLYNFLTGLSVFFFILIVGAMLFLFGSIGLALG